MPLGLRVKTFIAFIGLVVISSMLNVGIAYVAIQKELTNELVQRLVSNTRSEINDFTNFVLLGHKDDIINRIYNQKSTHKDLAYMFLLDENNEVIASTLLNQSPTYFIGLNVLLDNQAQRVNLIQQADGQYVYDIALRLEYNKGVLRAGYFKKQIDASVEGILYLLFIGVALSVSASFFVAYIFTRYFFRPLDVLKNAVEKITAGDLTYKVVIKSRDELGYLATAFNAMTMTLANSYQQVRDEKARLLASINSLNFGFIMADLDHTIILKNPALMRILNIPIESHTIDAVSKQLQNFAAEKINFSLLDVCQQCVTSRRAIEINEVSYGQKYLRIFCSPVALDKLENDISGEKIIGYVFLVEDITEAKIMERSRDEFFSIASHELRTPLTAIRGNSDMILDIYKDKIEDKDVKSMLSDINVSSVRLIDIVNDFLEVSQLEQNKIDVKNERIHVVDSIEKVVRNLKSSIERDGVSLSLISARDGWPDVVADSSRVEQVLVNLIGNAAKFTKQGSITITIDVIAPFLKISITDTGMGISEVNQKLLFRKFQQAGESTLARDVTEGTGLGLYISRLLMAKMGGTIGLEKSEVGKGSTFAFTLPIAP